MKKYLFSIVFFLLLFEIGLRSIGKYKVYTEQIGRKYSSNWGFEHDSHFKLMPGNVIVRNDQKEFVTEYVTSTLGIRNPEISHVPSDSIFRILCFGDSFTEGDGASNGFPFPRQLERMLNDHHNQAFEVVNAGINGSDIIYIEKLFMDLGHRLSPKLVLIAINVSDIVDLTQRGGHERFKENGTTKFRDGPWFEKYYAKSHIVRFLVHAVFRKSQLLLGKKEEKRAAEEAKILMEESMLRVKKFADWKGIQLRFILHPIPASDMIYDADLEIKAEVNVEDYISKIGQDVNGKVIDINAGFVDTLRKLTYEDFAWRANGHYNDNGYKIMTEEIYEALLEDSVFPL